jgi:hypothetical protein
VKFSTIGHFESAERGWRRLLEIATDHFADTAADLVFLRDHHTGIEFHLDEVNEGYVVQLVGSEVDAVETRRTAERRGGFGLVLEALAVDTQDHEAAEGRRLAREVAKGALTFRYAHSLCEGFAVPSFDEELARYRAEIDAAKAASRPQRTKRWTFGGGAR